MFQKIRGRLKFLARPEKAFLLLGTVFGILMVFVNPPLQVPDEPNHLYRIYQLSTGKVVGERQGDYAGGEVPISLSKFEADYEDIKFNHANKIFFWGSLKEQLRLKLNRNESHFVQFYNTALYSPVPYVPSAIGFVILKPFNPPPIILLYFGRILTLATFLVITFLAIRMIPILKWVLTLVALMPMVLNQAASLSADAVTISLTLLFLAVVMKNIFAKRTESLGMLVIVILGILLTLSKQAYGPLVLLSLLIPMRNFGGFKSAKMAYSIFNLIAIIVPLFILALWSKVVNHLMLPTFDFIQPTEQIRFIFHHPLTAFWTLVNGSITWFNGPYANSTIGLLGWLNIVLPWWVLLGYKFALPLAFLDEKKSEQFSFQTRLFFIILGCVEVLVIALLIYISWNPVGSAGVDGLQGRYYIPLLPLLFLPFYSERFQTKKPIVPYAVLIGFISIALIATLWTLRVQFYL